MRKKKNNLDLSNFVFDKGIEMALYPLNVILRKLTYPWSVVLSLLAVVIWSMPIIIAFSIIANTIFVIEILIKILKR